MRHHGRHGHRSRPSRRQSSPAPARRPVPWRTAEEPSAGSQEIAEPIKGSEKCRTTAAPLRGWHGITARNQGRYTPEDWKNYDQMGAPDAFIVDVADYSPAWRAGLRSGSWIVEIDGKSFEDFERFGSAVGAAVIAKAYHPVRGAMDVVVTLVARPKVERAMLTTDQVRVPHAQPGAQVAKRDRPRWEMVISMSHLSCTAKSLAMLLSTHIAGKAGDDFWCRGWSATAIGRAFKKSRWTVIRAAAELHSAGFLKIEFR